MAEACRTLAHLVGPAALRAFGLPMHTLERFTTALTLCGWIQDMGKGNSHFQEMLANGTRRQLLRHEIVSGLLVWYHLRDWLAPLGDVLVPALWAALGHHRKVGPSVRIEQVDELTVYLGHPDMAELLADMAYDLGLSSPPPLAQELHIGRDIDKGGLRVPRCTSDMLRDFRQCESHFTDPAPRRELALLKSFGIAADMAASAIPKHGEQDARYSVGEIITNRMESGVTPDDLDELIRSW